MRLAAECRGNEVSARICWGHRGQSELRFHGYLHPRSRGCDLVGRIATPKSQVLLLVAIIPALMWWEDFGIADIIGGTALAAALSLFIVHLASHGPRRSLVNVLRRAINMPMPRADN